MKTELGSDFHFLDNIFQDNADNSIEKIYPESNIYFSGRSALFYIIQLGIQLYGWRNLYLPEYYCHDVVHFIQKLPINLCYYDDGPYTNSILDVAIIDRKENVFLHVNYFGFGIASRLVLSNAFIIEDHTHDLTSTWALNSTAHYCFASLRKILPVPAGGIVWSPQKLQLPCKPLERELSNTAAYMKLSAMLLKKNYLEGGNIEKQEFRNLFLNSELLFEEEGTNGNLPAIILELIKKISINALREHKSGNYQCLYQSVKTKQIIWGTNQEENQCPLGLVMYFEESNKRDSMKKFLVENKIYPAVLWPNQKERKAKEFSHKSLFIHCDIRYDLNDMLYLAENINNFNGD